MSASFLTLFTAISTGEKTSQKKYKNAYKKDVKPVTKDGIIQKKTADQFNQQSFREFSICEPA